MIKLILKINNLIDQTIWDYIILVENRFDIATMLNINYKHILLLPSYNNI